MTKVNKVLKHNVLNKLENFHKYVRRVLMQFDGLTWCTYQDDNTTKITFLDLNNKTWVVATWTIIGFSKVDTHFNQMIESSFYSMIVAKGDKCKHCTVCHQL